MAGFTRLATGLVDDLIASHTRVDTRIGTLSHAVDIQMTIEQLPDWRINTCIYGNLLQIIGRDSGIYGVGLGGKPCAIG